MNDYCGHKKIDPHCLSCHIDTDKIEYIDERTVIAHYEDGSTLLRHSERYGWEFSSNDGSAGYSHAAGNHD